MSDKFYEKQLKEFGIEQTRSRPEDFRQRSEDVSAEVSRLVIQQIMGTMAGRQWMHERLTIAGVFSTPFVPGHRDMSDFLCGAHAMGWVLLQEVMASSPDKFYLMNQEAAARKVKKPESAEEEEEPLY